MPNPLRAFINFNKKCHSLTAKIFPSTKHSAYSHYREEVRRNLADNISVLDIGGGKHCAFASERAKFTGIKITALGVSAEYSSPAENSSVYFPASLHCLR